MLYYKFHDYEEFKELFGIQHHGNGVKSRKNKILLAYIKNRELLHAATTSGDYHLLHLSSMSELKQVVTEEIVRSGSDDASLTQRVYLNDRVYHSAQYYTDGCQGVCEDGDTSAVRYVNAENGRVFKMKAGKFYRKLIQETSFGESLPEQVINYLCEEMSLEWQSYATGCLPSNMLVVDRNFGRIYDSNYCVGDFHSCMADQSQHYFYEDAVDASAARLENEDGDIIARCIIYNKVRDQHGNVWRLAERQYATDSSEILKRALVDALIKGGHIDGYKVVGAGCGDSREFVDTEGNSLSHLRLSIDCNLDYGDTLSYQDSFKNYDINSRIATNYGHGDLDLETTDSTLEGEDRPYDDYHECYCDETTLVYRDGQEYYCDSDRLEDFIYIELLDEYHHVDDVSTCEECGAYYLDSDGCYSEVTGQYYCDSDCCHTAEERYKERHWTYSDYDEEYFEDPDDVVEYMCWHSGLHCYCESTISRRSLDDLLARGDFYMADDVAYDEIDTETGRPYGEPSDQEALNEAA